MTEEEYQLVVSRVRITAALETLGGVIRLAEPGDDAILAEARRILVELEQDLFQKTQTTPS